MGVLDHLSDYFDCSSHSSKHKKRKQLQVNFEVFCVLDLYFGLILCFFLFLCKTQMLVSLKMGFFA